MTTQPDVNPLKPLKKLSSFNLPWSTDWTAIFGVERPLILEIGFGYGHYLEHLAKLHPDHNIIGLEINNFCMVKMERVIERKQLNNVRVVFSRAETALNHLFEPEIFSEIHVNFPDPWFKERHSRRRLMQRDTLDMMVSRLKPNGMLYLATDIIEYAEMSHEILADTAGLTNTLETNWVNQFDGRIITKYERRAGVEGRQCYYFAYQRNDTPVEHTPVIKEIDMPHIVIKTPLSVDDMLEQFNEMSTSEGETHIKIMNGYRGKIGTLLFEAYVHEPTIDQKIALMLVKRDVEGEYTMKLSGIGNPRPTDGLHRAVAFVADWLVSLHAESEVLKRKVRF